MVSTGERTLSDTSGARQFCPRAQQTAADNYVYGLSGVLKSRLERAHQGTDSQAKLRHSPGMPAAEKRKFVYVTPNYVTSHAVEFALCISSTQYQCRRPTWQSAST